VWITLIGISVQFFLILGIIIFLFFGVSFILLCWFAYTQWVFDMFVTPAVKAEKEAAKAKMTPKQIEAEKEVDEKAVARQLLAAGKSELIGKPIKPIDSDIAVSDIGVTFSRKDVKRAQDDRQTLEKGVADYYEQHKNDTVYVEYNKLFAEREKALQTPEKKGKKKRISSNNLLK
jgi:hypothetical protein